MILVLVETILNNGVGITHPSLSGYTMKKDREKNESKKQERKEEKKEKGNKKKVIKHLKGDIKTFKEEASEDKELISSLSNKSSKKSTMKKKVKKDKMKKVMKEFKSGKLHSGSKSGPKVTNPKQAVAIAINESKKAKKKKK